MYRVKYKGNPLISGKPMLVKFHNLARCMIYHHLYLFLNTIVQIILSDTVQLQLVQLRMIFFRSHFFFAHSWRNLTAKINTHEIFISSIFHLKCVSVLLDVRGCRVEKSPTLENLRRLANVANEPSTEGRN